MRSILAPITLTFLAALTPPRAEACGGLVQPPEGTVGIDVQRAFFVVGAESTRIVLQIVVPQSPNDYGVIVPVPAQPTLDEDVVEAAAFDELDRATAPQVVVADSEREAASGCGCGAEKSDGALQNQSPDSGVTIGQQLDIGPVSAVTLTATTGESVRAWLSQNGFVLPLDAQPIVDSYSGPGKWFVAFKRASATPSTASTVGIRMSAPGDHRSFAIRMASIGARPEVAITVFVGSPEPSGPGLPWDALTLEDLDPGELTFGTYRNAVRAAVYARSGQAFVIEGVFARAELPSNQLTRMLGSARLTRLTTVLSSGDMTTDVSFTGPVPANVPRRITVGGAAGGPAGASPSKVFEWGMLCGLARIARRLAKSTSRRLGRN
ncbi:MAG: DUF2330 domain-containing protein [Deltaproteobacteria bacterium]|nr:DUF2330 domain-containing protein [Deltaproteobacteria bacterium]